MARPNRAGAELRRTLTPTGRKRTYMERVAWEQFAQSSDAYAYADSRKADGLTVRMTHPRGCMWQVRVYRKALQ
jgi:hypothetical protein